MAINFPNSPTTNQQFEADGRIWKYNGSVWEFLGYPGPANDLTVGTVTTGEAGTDAAVEITGNTPEQIINFTIPKGDQGITGDDGIVVQATEPENTDILWVDTSEDGSTVGGGADLYYLVEASNVSTVLQTLPANYPYLLRAFSTGATETPVSIYDSTDTLLETVNVTFDGVEIFHSVDVAKFLVVNGTTDKIWFAITSPTDAGVEDSRKTFVITSTQSITLAEDYDAYLLGGGGGGGGQIASSPLYAGAGGGGSGYFASGIITAGTYTATIGAGGVGSDGASGTQGGTTSIGALSAVGGSGGLRSITEGVGTAGGNGGSGGGGGAADTSLLTRSNSGYNGANGSVGLGSLTPGAGGTGSSTTLPVQDIFNTILQPPTEDTNGGGGVYQGGGGGGITNNANDGTSATNYGGGGRGADGALTAKFVRFGGNGFQGVIVLVERVA